MVEVSRTGFLSEIRGQSTYREFPDDEFRRIRSAVADVPAERFEGYAKGNELKQFDAAVAQKLPDYEHEHDGDTGRNSVCKLWDNEGFDHSVDLYNAEKRIAVEIEKSERKRVSDDILKFIKGGKTQQANRKKIEFGCLIVPTNYRDSGDLFSASMRNLEFIRSVLFVEDIAVLGYVDPRWE